MIFYTRLRIIYKLHCNANLNEPIMPSTDKSDVFLQVIEAHKNMIYKIANTYCKDSDDRMDLVQEIILKLWQSFDSYNAEYKYSTWIYRVALNTAISLYRKNKTGNRKTASFPEGIINMAGSGEDTGMNQNTILLNRFVDELKPLDKALVLLYLEEKTQKEIADIMGITETNVSTKIARIKNILKQKFSQIKT